MRAQTTAVAAGLWVAFLVACFMLAPALIHGGLHGIAPMLALLAVVFLVVYVATVIPLARREADATPPSRTHGRQGTPPGA